MDMVYMFELPISVTLPRKTKEDKKVMLNMNVYRNLHHALNSQAKKLFAPIKSMPFKADTIEISYTVLKPTKRKYDTMNIVSVVDKFFLDWLVDQGMIPDDTCDRVSYGRIVGWTNREGNCIIAQVKVVDACQQ